MGSLRQVDDLPVRLVVPEPRSGVRRAPADDGPARSGQEPLLLRGEDGRVYVITAYDVAEDGAIEPTQKVDVTESFDDLKSSFRLAHGPALYLFASKLHKLAHAAGPEASREAQVAAIAGALAEVVQGG